MNLSLKILDATHADYDHEALEELDALYEGGDDAREHMRTWMPQHEMEPQPLYDARIKRAVYDNHVGPIVDLIVAWMFSKPPTIEGLDASWLADVDGRGTDLALWVRGAVTDAMQFRTCYVWTNLPKRPDGVKVDNRADEEAMRLHIPFLVNIEACDVRRWWDDSKGNLKALLFRQDIEEGDSIEQAPTFYRVWTYIDATKIRRWKLPWPENKKPADGDEKLVAAEEPEILHGMGRMPVARMCLPAGLHVVQKLRDPAVGLLRLENDYDWKLHRDAHNLLVIKSKDAAQKPTLGAGYYLNIGAEDEALYVAPSGTVYTAYEKRIQDRRETLYRLVQQMAQGVAGKGQAQAASAASKAMDWQSLQVMLAAYAEHVKGLLVQVAQTVAKPFLVDPAKVKVAGLEGWHEDDIATILAAYLEASPMVKSATFRRLLAKLVVRQLAPDDLDQKDRDAIEKEIDAANYDDVELYPTQPTPPADPAADPNADPAKAAA